jgi:hypothetical protein
MCFTKFCAFGFSVRHELYNVRRLRKVASSIWNLALINFFLLAVVVQQPGVTIMHQVHFGESPVTTVCPHCQATVTTTATTQVGVLPWIVCVVLFVVG